MNNKLQTITNLFEEKEIRSFWDSEKEEYYFSVIDVIGALTDNDYDKSRNYWKWSFGVTKRNNRAPLRTGVFQRVS